MDALLEGQQLLLEKGIESARLECEMLMSHILKCERHQLYIMGNEPLELSLQLAYQSMLEKRLNGEPIQYILGNKEFMGLSLNVDRRVLIPRFDTEVLVESVLDAVASKPAPIRILDLGTGSGAIAISLAVHLPKSVITAVDIKEDALCVAQHNAELNMVSDKIDFYCGDLFYALDNDRYQGFFDVIVSNPPYIPSSDIDSLMTEVKDFEPRSALDGGRDGLDFYRRIADTAYKFLRLDGLVAVEIGYGQGSAVRSIFQEVGKYCEMITIKDLAGIDRVAAFNKLFKE